MRIFRRTAALPDWARGGTVTIGNFDGVHLGHRGVVGEARRIADELGGPLALVTFEPHPRRFFRPDGPPFQLTPLRSKIRRLRAGGIDVLQLLQFDEAFSRIDAQAFVQRVVIDGLAARHVVVGYDFVFGHRRAGDVDLLAGLAARRGFGFTAVPPVKVEGGPVHSSTNIRNHLAAGEPSRAAELLGRCWEIEGRVRRGDRRGGGIGFPTANLSLDGYIEPALGVYAVWAGLEEGGATAWRMGCANIGRRPTFGGAGVVLEAHLFDFARDIYDQRLRVALVDFLRPEAAFDGVAQLRAQIARDCAQARSLLKELGPEDLRAPPEPAPLRNR